VHRVADCSPHESSECNVNSIRCCTRACCAHRSQLPILYNQLRKRCFSDGDQTTPFTIISKTCWVAYKKRLAHMKENKSCHATVMNLEHPSTRHLFNTKAVQNEEHEPTTRLFSSEAVLKSEICAHDLEVDACHTKDAKQHSPPNA